MGIEHSLDKFAEMNKVFFFLYLLIEIYITYKIFVFSIIKTKMKFFKNKPKKNFLGGNMFHN